ncbi:MAG: serine hydrolase domain-containing protein [Bacteroidota bacterium]
MTKKIILILLSLFIISTLQSQERDQLKKEIDKIIHYDTNIKFTETPGMVIGVKYQDSVFFYGFGSTSKDVEKMPNENTIFEIGGLTKAFTASLVGVLVNEGKMDYDQPFNAYLPPTEQNQYLEKLTIGELITHTSQMPRMPTEFGVKEREPNNPYAHYTKQDLMGFYKDYIIIPSKRKEKKRKRQSANNYAYSHVNYALLERAIENSQKTDFSTILSDQILMPIGMMDTKVELSSEQAERLAKGYNVAGTSTPPWTFQSFEASQGLKSTAKDLMKFMETHMGKRNPELTAAFELTHGGRIQTGLDKRVEVSKGWHIISPKKKYHDIVAHTGNTNGHRAYIAFVKESETAVVILSNSERNLQNLGYLILSMLNNNWKK